MIVVNSIIIVLAILVVLLIRAELQNKRKQIYFFKPVATLSVISLVALSFFMETVNMLYSSGIMIGLLFSFGGDISLMFKTKKGFMIGLVFFLIAHIVYAAIFTYLNGFFSKNYFNAFILLTLAVIVYAYLYSGLQQMKIPVLIYVIIISVMVNSAISTTDNQLFSNTQVLFISLGALLFYISDLILAINRFKKPFKYNRISLAFYYAGQLLIAMSTVLFKPI